MKIFQVGFLVIMIGGSRLVEGLKSRCVILKYVLFCVYKCEPFVDVTFTIKFLLQDYLTNNKKTLKTLFKHVMETF